MTGQGSGIEARPPLFSPALKLSASTRFTVAFLIPYGMDYTAHLSGSILKMVRCEQCAQDYVYVLTRSAEGQGRSLLFLDNEGARERAASRAERRLREKLERSCDPVPCLHCGW